MKKRLIILAVIVLAIAVLWVFVLTKTFLFVSTDTGEFRIYRNGVSLIDVQKDGVVYLEKGHYTISPLKNGKPTTVSYLTTNWLPWQSTSVTSAQEYSSLKPQLILGRNSTLITPLGSGYIYKNTDTRGIEFVDASGIKDVSDRFDIVSKSISGSNDSYNTVVNIERTDNTVYVTTTRAIFRMTSLNDITSSKLSDLLITRSSIDASAGKVSFITFVGNGTYSAYSLPLDNLRANIQQVYSGKQLINHIATNGNYALVYDDNVPNQSSSTAKSYSSKKQVAPQLINLKTLQPKAIPNLPNTTFTDMSLSGDGKYIAYRTKLSDTIHIITATDGQTVATLPATTLSLASWRGSSLVYNYGDLLLLFDATKATSPQVVLATNAPIIDVSYDGTAPVVTTSEGFTYIGASNAKSIDTSVLELSSSSEAYTLAFSAIGGSVQAYTMCEGYDLCDFGSQYDKTIKALSALGAVTNHNVSSDFFISNYSYARE